jgi:hypothetical protein
VLLAIEREVPWARARALLERNRPDYPVLPLVGKRDQVHGITLFDPPSGKPVIELTGNVEGKFCIRPPNSVEAYCVQGSSRHISRAFVRETVRNAVNAYGLTELGLVPDEDLEWVNVVRLIDGARTCCPGVVVSVGLGVPAKNQEEVEGEDQPSDGDSPPDEPAPATDKADASPGDPAPAGEPADAATEPN